MSLDQTSVVRERPADDYGTLMAEVRRARLLERSGLAYLPRVGVLVAMLLGGVVAFVAIGDSWWQLFVAAYLAVVFAQLGFLGHDAGHQQIVASRRWNRVFGLVLSNLAIGLSYSWWVDKHNRHHRNPNDVSRDPDVKGGAIAWTPEQAAAQRGPLRLLVRHQAVLFFPMLLLEAWHLHVQSVRTLVTRPRGRIVEIVLLATHVAVCLAVVLLVLSPIKAVVFVMVQQALLGVYLGCSFAPNHKGMKLVDGDDDVDFLRRQVLTSRNVTGGRLVATVFGGLNYQIEHHLFPSMPSRNLRRCRPMVKRFCAAHGVPYVETDLFSSYARVLRYLGGVRPVTR